ncbi:DUF6159 family protein [Methanosphaerula palustris]|uniref:Glycerophosphoryl diester phosphodiesterase membrane domain-containing protein n=1 Tax=Methanosphaerula palustris (strain ATCC BAA-1556 / DSM 19958 / E1-9c) TaxID=521011 RepID=B8GIY6_METPE|nr:DUF6159 family protein [Methanosphaerula palustris]ACL15559.1 conserved hypothetical protein [Methanosphaerula palustris E1-9c]
MFERISRSIELVKMSWRILMEDKKLLVFPILSGIVMLIVIATFILPLIFSKGAFSLETNSITGIILLFLFYLVSYFVVIFFNVGLISCVYAKLQGNAMTVGGGLAAAGKHLGSILAWAIIAATVGLILRLIEDREGTIGQIVGGLVGGVWSLITMFVVPVLVFEDRGVFDAMKGSLGLFKKTWGESAVGSLSIGLVFVAIGIIGFLLMLATLLLNDILVFFAAVAIYVVLIAILAILASAMQGIFVVALYIYAKTGQVPPVFNRDLVEGAFTPRSQKFGGTI